MQCIAADEACSSRANFEIPAIQVKRVLALIEEQDFFSGIAGMISICQDAR